MLTHDFEILFSVDSPFGKLDLLRADNHYFLLDGLDREEDIYKECMEADSSGFITNNSNTFSVQFHTNEKGEDIAVDYWVNTRY